MANLQMDYNLVSSEVDAILASSKTMGNHLNTVWGAIQKLQNSWDSEVYEDIKKEYTRLTNLVEEQSKALTNRATVLRQAAEAYSETESKIKEAGTTLSSALKF